jgi:hypothetical protein
MFGKAAQEGAQEFWLDPNRSTVAHVSNVRKRNLLRILAQIDRLCGRSSWRSSGFDYMRYQIFREVDGSETGSTQPREYN